METTDNWKAELKADPTEWLLEEENPSVRYYTLTDILNESPESKLVKSAKKKIMTTGLVPAILAKQENGVWDEPDRFYVAKYTGTVWQLLILAEAGATIENQGIKKACEFILENAQDRESQGFAMHHSKTGGGRHSEVIPCLTGNLAWALIRLGYSPLDDKRVENALQWITRHQRFDDGDGEVPTGWPYDKYEMCWGRHTCHMGAVKALKALAAVPADKRSSSVQKTLKKGTEYMLKHRIFRRSHDPSKTAKPGWLRFGFPLMYQTDALEIAGILACLGYRDKRMQDAIDLIRSKQDDHGRWKLENTFNGRYWNDIEAKGKPSKWITLHALRVLKNFYCPAASEPL